MIDYKIWCTYHEERLKEEYNLKETNNFKLFYTKANLKGYSINFAQLYLNEFVTQYYVYKNQLKSDLVGFCHYKRNLSKFIDDELLNHIFNYSQYRTFISNSIDELYMSSIANDNIYTLAHNMELFGLNIHIDLIKEYVKNNYSNYI